MVSAKTASTIDVRIDDVGRYSNSVSASPFGKNSAGFCHSVWLPQSILNFRIGSVSSIGGLSAATLFADTISDSQRVRSDVENRNERTFACSPGTKNRNEGTFAKTTVLCNRPFVSSRKFLGVVLPHLPCEIFRATFSQRLSIFPAFS